MLFFSYSTSDMLGVLPCSARELWRKPFLSPVLTFAVLGPVLVQQVSCDRLSSGAAWRKEKE